MVKLTAKDLRDTKNALEKKIMLDMMQIESKRWPSLVDINAKVDENVILPQTILNYVEYQKRL